MEEKQSSVKIAIVRPFFTLSKGGGERYAVQLAKALSARRFDVHIFAHEWDRPEDPRIVYHRIEMVRKLGWLRLLTFQRNLVRCLVPDDFDAILGLAPFLPQTVSRLGDGLSCVWVRIAWPVKFWRWLMCIMRTVMLVNLWFERQIMTGKATHFIANSELVKTQAVKYYHVPQERISVVYNGIDLDRFSPSLRQAWRAAVRRELGISDETFVLLFVSNNFQRKGLDCAVRALAKVSRVSSAVKLLVVGAGRSGPFRRLARRNGIEDRVLFVGPTATVERYYGAADAFVLPTRYDPFAGVCLEAMACGLPVITTCMNGAAELIEDGKNGFVIARSETEDHLVKSIEQALEPGRCTTMGAAAAQRATAFSFEHHADQMLNILGRIVEHERSKKSLRVIRLTPEFIVNRDHLSLLEAHDLTSFPALMSPEGAVPIKSNKVKRIVAFRLEGNGRTVTLYLKWHRSRPLLSDWFRYMVGRPMVGEGMKEWRNILAFRAYDLPVVTPVAAGQRWPGYGTKESFSLTLGLDDYSPLDEYVLGHFGQPLSDEKLRQKRILIRSVAGLTRNMHWSGFNHQDYYLCHLFLKENDGGELDVRVIDLQRVGYQRWLRRRWIVKDLAELYYSSLATPLTQIDRLRFFAWYSRGNDDRATRRCLLRRVIRKARAIATHDSKRVLADDSRETVPSMGESP